MKERKKPLREIIQEVKPGETLTIEGTERAAGFRCMAYELNHYTTTETEKTLLDGKPKYSIASNKKLNKLFIINNLPIDYDGGN